MDFVWGRLVRVFKEQFRLKMPCAALSVGRRRGWIWGSDLAGMERDAPQLVVRATGRAGYPGVSV
jgi:hypothetical protein